MPKFLSALTAEDLNQLDRSKTVFFIPVGPLEDHGPHLPLGADVEEAQALCALAAQRLESERPEWHGIVLPQVPLGLQSDTTQLALIVRPHVLRDCLVDWCKSLHRRGFYHFVCFSGHLGPRQLTAIEDAGKILGSEGGMFRWGLQALGRAQLPILVSASSALTGPKDVKRAPFWPDPVEHGGERDTSVALAVCPGQVRPYGALPWIPRNSSWWARFRMRKTRQLFGYWGDPSRATAEQGGAYLHLALDQVYPKLRAVWDGTHPRWLFRSWFSVLFPNKSFFKAWVLVGIILVLFTLWWMIFSSQQF